MCRLRRWLKLLMNTATRDVPAGGIALSMADFLLFALMLAKGRPGNIINRVDGVVRKSSADVESRGSTALPSDASAFPAHWISLQDFVCTLATAFKGLPHCPMTVRYLKGQITDDPLSLMNSNPGKGPLDAYKQGKDVVCVNGDKDPFADIVVFAHGLNGNMIVFLVQCKRCLHSRLTVNVVDAELDKMGCKGRGAKGDHPIAKKWGRVIKKGAVEYRFVIVVYGMPPEPIPADWNRNGVHYVACDTGKFFLVDVHPEVKDEERNYTVPSY